VVRTELPKLEMELMRAVRGGSSVLPEDLGRLRGYLRMIGTLLEEKANELEPSWEQACAAAAEIRTLQELEQSVAERAIAIRAQTVDEVRSKLAIWRAIAPDCDCDDDSPRNRLVLSVEADLERIGRELRR
jgi:hypothetical protein